MHTHNIPFSSSMHSILLQPQQLIHTHTHTYSLFQTDGKLSAQSSFRSSVHIVQAEQQLVLCKGCFAPPSNLLLAGFML